MQILKTLLTALRSVEGGEVVVTQGHVGPEAKLKHLDLIQAAIARMANNSFLFKGWAITIATALAGFAAVNNRYALLVIAIITTTLFWGLDGYYLWLERGFATLHKAVAKRANNQIDFNMVPDKTNAFGRWILACLRWHILFFYGVIIIVEVIAIFVIRKHV